MTRKAPTNKPQWWEVSTGCGGMSENTYCIGRFFGTVHEIAAKLADFQVGFWSEGTLDFKRSDEQCAKLPVKDGKRWKTKGVNVTVRGIDWGREDELPKAEKFFKGSGVEVVPCNLYGAVTIKPKTKNAH